MKTSNIIKKLLGNRQVKGFCKQHGFAETSMHNWIKDRVEPSFFNVQAIANACGYRLKFEEIVVENNILIDVEGVEYTYNYKRNEEATEVFIGDIEIIIDNGSMYLDYDSRVDWANIKCQVDTNSGHFIPVSMDINGYTVKFDQSESVKLHDYISANADMVDQIDDFVLEYNE